jgi:TolB protein
VYYERRSGPSRTLLLVIGLGLAAGVGAAAVLASPRVAASAPEAGASGVSSLSPVSLTFSQPMDMALAQGRVSFAPATEGEFEASADGRTLRFVPRQPWPRGATVTVSVAPGARSRLGLPMLAGANWQFSVGEPRIAYIVEANGPANVWIWRPSAGGAGDQFTTAEAGVFDFSASPDGTRLVYAARQADGAADLRLLSLDGSGDTLLLECPGEACRAPQWSPDGRRIAFERWPLAAAEDNPEPRVWLLDAATGEAEALDAPPGSALAPRWAPDGRRLAYYNPAAEQMVILDLEAGEATFIANASGEMGEWARDGLALIFPEIVFAGEAAAQPTPLASPTAPPLGTAAPVPDFFSHLVRVEVATRQIADLSLEPSVEDASAMPAPGGEWIAFGRKYLDAARWTPGRQLWLMRPDGSQAHALTGDGDFQHSAFAWSPDGQRLAYTRFDVATPGALPELWTINADGTEPQLVATGAYLPLWLP